MNQLAELRAELQSNGWTTIREKNHEVMVAPNGERMTLPTSGNLGGRRLANYRAQARRAYAPPNVAASDVAPKRSGTLADLNWDAVRDLANSGELRPAPSIEAWIGFGSGRVSAQWGQGNPIVSPDGVAYWFTAHDPTDHDRRLWGMRHRNARLYRVWDHRSPEVSDQVDTKKAKAAEPATPPPALDDDLRVELDLYREEVEALRAKLEKAEREIASTRKDLEHGENQTAPAPTWAAVPSELLAAAKAAVRARGDAASIAELAVAVIDALEATTGPA